jgi:hypothetical protein
MLSVLITLMIGLMMHYVGGCSNPLLQNTLLQKLKKEASFVLTALHQLIPMHHQIKVLVIQE